MSTGKLDRLQWRIEQLVGQLTPLNLSGCRAHTQWHPPLNAFRCDGHIVVCFDLAGVDKSTIDLLVEGRVLRLRGYRPGPEPAEARLVPRQILAMEIDHGVFERRLDLPIDVDTERVTAEYKKGLLWVRLPLRPES